MKKILSLAQVRQEHKLVCPEVSLEFFIEHYCKSILRNEKFGTVEIIVTPRFSFIFDK